MAAIAVIKSLGRLVIAATEISVIRISWGEKRNPVVVAGKTYGRGKHVIPNCDGNG